MYIRHCRKGSPLELTMGNTQNTDRNETMQRDANEHAPHWNMRQDKTNQQQTLQNKQWIIELQFTQHTIHYSNGKQYYTSLQHEYNRRGADVQKYEKKYIAGYKWQCESVP